jgi:hypothetical protein
MKICNTQGKVFNECRRSYIEPEPGQVWCPECKGLGCHPAEPIENFELVAQCKNCDGIGVLDWVERIVGKKRQFDFETYYASELAEEIRDEIDKEILGEINKEIIKSIGNKK